MNNIALGKCSFSKDSDQIWLSNLFNMECSNSGTNSLPIAAQGLVLLCSDGKRWEGTLLKCVEEKHTGDSLSISWKTADKRFHIESSWKRDPETGIISRKDKVTNLDNSSHIINRFLARFTYSCGDYEVYCQQGRWGNENQGKWSPLHTGNIVLKTRLGRTSEGGTPFLGIREKNGETGTAFHIIPCGNWMIRVCSTVDNNSKPYAVLELGQSDEDLHWKLKPGENMEMPEILIHHLQEGKIHSGTSALHHYICNRLKKPVKEYMPVIYNTWLDRMSNLEVPRLREQLKAAKEIGCEAFVIDAGWFGQDTGPDWSQKGDWREKLKAAFFGKMKEFADEVRSTGLGFGLWMEPELFNHEVPVVKEHPNWFLKVENSTILRINLDILEAREHQFKEIERLITTYGLAYIKLDMNYSLGFDPSGRELSDYAQHWYEIISTLRKKYPDTFFENCASGAMRTDINTAINFDCNFISDNANLIELLKVTQGMLLRFPPGRIMRWATIRSLGRINEKEESLAMPEAATWNNMLKVNTHFAMISSLMGMFGFSGDLAGIEPKTRELVSWYVDFYKKNRKFIITSVCHLLTPPESIECRSGWTAFQLQDFRTTASIVFVFRNASEGGDLKYFSLKNLLSGKAYKIIMHHPSGNKKLTVQGEDLMSSGLEVAILSTQHSSFEAAVFTLELEN